MEKRMQERAKGRHAKTRLRASRYLRSLLCFSNPLRDVNDACCEQDQK